MIALFIYSLALFFTSTTPAQKEITVIFNGKQSKLVKFELQLIKDLINYYADQNQQRIKIKYRGIKDNNSGFSLLDQGNPDHTLVINKLAISKQKLASYDFSTPYINNYYLLGSRKDFTFIPNEKKVRVGYLRHKSYKQFIQKIGKAFSMQTSEYKSYKKAIADLKARRIDLLLTDYVNSVNNNLKIAQTFDSRVEKLAIMFQKGSKLKGDLDLALKSFKKTASYKKLVNKHFGKEADMLYGSVLPL